MSEPTPNASLTPADLARDLGAAERELSRQARELFESGNFSSEAWFRLIEEAGGVLRRWARSAESGELRLDAAGTLPKAGPEPALPKRQRKASNERASNGVLTGHAGTVPVSDLLGFLSNLRKSGVLWVITQGEDFLLQLERGSVVYAQGDAPPEGQRLGEILVRHGALARERLDPVLDAASEQGEVLGAYLVRSGTIRHDELTVALSEQAQGIFHRMFSTLDAHWRFEEDVRMVDSQDVRLNVIQLLLESARLTDERHARIMHDVGITLARSD